MLHPVRVIKYLIRIFVGSQQGFTARFASMQFYVATFFILVYPAEVHSQNFSDMVRGLETQLRGLEALEREQSEKCRAISWAKGMARLELLRGHYCSKCNRTKTELDKTVRGGFYQHLSDVNATAVPASEEQIRNKEDALGRQLEQCEQQEQALRDQIADINQQIANLRDQKRKQEQDRYNRQMQEKLLKDQEEISKNYDSISDNIGRALEAFRKSSQEARKQAREEQEVQSIAYPDNLQEKDDPALPLFTPPQPTYPDTPKPENSEELSEIVETPQPSRRNILAELMDITWTSDATFEPTSQRSIFSGEGPEGDQFEGLSYDSAYSERSDFEPAPSKLVSSKNKPKVPKPTGPPSFMKRMKNFFEYWGEDVIGGVITGENPDYTEDGGLWIHDMQKVFEKLHNPYNNELQDAFGEDGAASEFGDETDELLDKMYGGHSSKSRK